MSRTALRRRMTAGFLVGALVAVGVAWTLAASTARRQAGQANERSAVASVLSLADLLERAGAVGPTARRTVELWARDAPPDLRAVRLVDLPGRTLEASTSPVDRARGVPPRRLVREEKPYFDLGQELRAAVETNQQEESVREQEVRIGREEGAPTLAAPVEREGAVVAMVETVLAPRGPPPVPSALPPLLWAAGATLLFYLLARFAGERERTLAVAGALLLVAMLAGYASRAAADLATARRGSERTLAAELTAQRQRAERVLAELGVAATPPLAPSRWDADLFRRPLGLIDDAGAVAAARLDAEISDSTNRLRNALIGAALVSLMAFAAVALGGIARAWRTLVRHRVAYAYTLPALVGMLLLAFFPLFYGVALSFTNASIYNTDKSIPEIWVGLENFKEILGNFALMTRHNGAWAFDYTNFYYTLGFTILWTVSNVAIGVSVGLVLALILNRKGLALKPLYRVLLILPWAVPNYITALIWKGMFHQQFGVINQAIQMFGGSPVSWFESPATSFVTVLATNGWLSFPFMMVISLGALQSIPADLYEAARVDGASRWQQFKFITLPSLKPALVPAIIISVIWTFNMFNIIYLVSAGQPAGATEILITESYKLAFEQYRYGYAAAYSTVIFLILLAYGTWQNRVTRATEGI